MFHVKDAELNPSGRSGVYGGYADWVDRAGRFRSLGDGQVDFMAIFSKLAQYGYSGWAVLEWECCNKDSFTRCRRRCSFYQRSYYQRLPKGAFDDFAGAGADDAFNRRVMGL